MESKTPDPLPLSFHKASRLGRSHLGFTGRSAVRGLGGSCLSAGHVSRPFLSPRLPPDQQRKHHPKYPPFPYTDQLWARARGQGAVHTGHPEPGPGPTPRLDTLSPPLPVPAHAGAQMRGCDRPSLARTLPEHPSGSGNSGKEPGCHCDRPLDLSQDSWAHTTHCPHVPDPANPQGNAWGGDNTGAGTELLRGSTYRSSFLPSRPGRSLGPRSPWNSDGPSSTGRTSLPWRSLGRGKKVVYFKSSPNAWIQLPKAPPGHTTHPLTLELTVAPQGPLQTQTIWSSIWGCVSDALFAPQPVIPSHSAVSENTSSLHESWL